MQRAERNRLCAVIKKTMSASSSQLTNKFSNPAQHHKNEKAKARGVFQRWIVKKHQSLKGKLYWEFTRVSTGVLQTFSIPTPHPKLV